MDIGHILRTVGDPLFPGIGSRPAIAEEDDRVITYAELRSLTEVVAGGLQRAGVRPGDRVGLLMRNSTEYWAYYFAVTSLGAIAVKLNWRLTREELDYAISDSASTTLLVDAELADKVDFSASRAGRIRVFALATGDSTDRPDWAGDARGLETGPPCPLNAVPWPDDTPAAMMYTSGTTGRPKGAVWTHGNVTAYAAMQVMKWGFGPHTCALTMGPFYHVGGFENLLLPTLLMKGQAVFMRSGGFSIERCVEVLSKKGVNAALIYPFAIRDMLETSAVAQWDLSALELLVTGGSAISLPTVRKLRQVLPDVGLVQTYGLTEGGAISTASDPADADRWPEAVGQPFTMTELIVSDDGESACPPGQVGEVLVRSPSVAAGYWNRPAESEETFRGGWCRTGDLGRISPEGRLVITGRKKDMIRSGGENIYPAELEMVLGAHDAVADIAIVGVPDYRYEEAVCAVVVKSPGSSLTEDEFKGYARDRLAGYKAPKHVVFVDELPRNASGKILKYRLKADYERLGSSAAPEPGTSPEPQPGSAS